MSLLRNSPSGPLVTRVADLDIQRFSVPGSYTWLKPAGARSIDLYLFPVGSPAGSGRNNGAIGVTNSSGAPGASPNGPRVYRDLDPDLFGATVTVVIGADSIGGASVVAGATNGNPGIAGGTTSFDSFTAPAGAPSGGGTTGNPSSTLNLGAVIDFIAFSNTNGGSGNATGVGGNGLASANLQGPGAGAGGGIPIAGTAFNGGSSGTSPIHPTATGGTTTGDKNGRPGANAGDGLYPGGSGSGGASSSDGSAAGNGGDGGFPSGAGGGGGASAGGGPSGAGGKGGGALVVVVTRVIT